LNHADSFDPFPCQPPLACLVGTLERSTDFVKETGFPSDCLLADPDGATYAALGLVKGVRQTFFSEKVGVLEMLMGGAAGTENLFEVL
jgi:hypothetical protein